MAKGRRMSAEVNAGSMADIAFLLLIFFLVTTTINTDKGIPVRLPPPPEPDQVIDDVKIKEKNVFKILVNASDQLLVEGEPFEVKNLKDATKRFIANWGQDPTSSDSPMKAVISLKNDRGTSYDMYIQVYDALKAAYQEVRDTASEIRYGRTYTFLAGSRLESDQKKAEEIKNIYIQIISEAEPENKGGK
jgi:biopolymer transport protein ExbD